MQAAGEVPSVEASIARIHNTQLEQEVGHVGLALLGARGQLRPGDRWGPLRGELHRYWTRNIPSTLAGGSLEIQKNIVAQRGLGLPRPT
jgi:alkylation response protein AidB-like acyl-CoA dehydrogenase